MPFTRPSVYPDWALTGTRTDPGSSAKNTGYAPNFRPPAEWHNWQFGYVGDWLRWLDQQQQANAAQFDYDATVGSGGTFADINSLMAAGNIATLKKILVFSPLTLTATQVINQPDMEFVFKPQAVLAKGGATTPGISIAADRITFRGARFSNFNGGSDVALQIEATHKNCIIISNKFQLCTTAINDLGTNNALVANIEEV